MTPDDQLSVAFSRNSGRSEIRLEVPDDELAVLDGYCQAAGKARTDVIRALLSEWSGKKLHEATLILRVARGNTGASESDRSRG